jgi:hypothetical protein
MYKLMPAGSFSYSQPGGPPCLASPLAFGLVGDGYATYATWSWRGQNNTVVWAKRWKGKVKTHINYNSIQIITIRAVAESSE